MTPAAPSLFTRRLSRMLVLWLLAAVLPLHGAAVGVFMAKGPAHAHRAAATQPLLEDLRRWRPAATAPAHAFAALGHFHASAMPERHHHRGDDASVMRDNRAEPGDTDEATATAAIAVLAMLPATATALPREAASARAMRPGWTPRTRSDPFPDRPPKRG